MKFSVKLTALFSGIFLVIGSITSYLIYTSNLKILEREIKDKLEDQAFHTMDKIDRMLFERFTDIKVIATDPVISSRNSTPKQIRERLIAYRNNYRSYVSLSFFDLNRVMITDTTGIDIGKQHPRITYWLDIAGGKEFIFDVSKSIPLGFSIFHFAMVVKDKNGSPFGVVVIRMPVEKLYDITKGTFGMDQEDEQGLTIDLVNKEGLLIYSNYNRKGILNEILPNWEYLKRFLKSGKKIGSFRQHYQGEDVIHVFALEQGYLDFKGEGWTFIIHAPTKVIFAPAIELRNRLIIVLLVIGFLAIFTIFLFSHTITRPLARLNHASIEIGKGNFDAKVEISSKDEIGQLSVSFNKMVEDLKEYRDKLLAYSSELETKVAERTIELKNANERLQLELIERKRAEEMLGALEERYRTLFEWAAEGILVADIESKQFKYVNPATCRMLGYTAEELTRLSLADIHPKEALDYVVAEFEALARGEKTLSAEIPCLRKDGSLIYTSIASAPVVIDGRKCNVGFFMDITERKRAEEALRETEKRFKLAAESSTDLIYEWDIKERVDWFGKIDELLGYAPGEFPRTIEAWANSIHPDDRDRVMTAVKNHLEKNEPYNSEYRIRNKDGTYHYWWARGTSVRDERGNPYRWVGAITDITERKRIEEELKGSEEKYRSLIQNIPDVVWTTDLNGKTIFISPQVKEFYGYGPEEIYKGGDDVWFGRIHPDDVEKVKGTFISLFEKGELFEVEYRIQRKDGDWIWLYDRATKIYKKNGIKYADGIFRDITDHKRAEEEREKLIHELQDALGKIKTLSGLLPICASCKKIRDDKGYWNQIEAYIGDHSEAEFTHSICPDCMKKLYPDFAHNKDKEVIKENIK